MGFDLVTVESVPQKEQRIFRKMQGDHGYFRHTGGIMLVLSYLGIDMKKIVADRTVGGMNENLYIYKTIPLDEAMGTNNGFQVTTEECLQIADVLTSESIPKALAATESHSPFAIPNNPGAVQFLLEFSEFCKAACKYGGYYNY